jgi:hypothetical protein
LTEAIDTTTPAGRMMMQMVGAFAEFEKAILRERRQVWILLVGKDAFPCHLSDLKTVRHASNAKDTLWT